MVVWGIVCTSVQADPLQNTLGSTMFTTITDSIHDSSSVTKEESQEESRRKIPLVKRKINHRRQVFLAAGMMVFVALIVSSAQMWNPK
jgi:hypothetical protein